MDNSSTGHYPAASLPPAYLRPGSSSFTDFLRAQAPDLLPSARRLPEGSVVEAPHGTTIVALTFKGGVVIAGDRRATMGNVISQRNMKKVFITDDYSAVGIAGTAGIAVEIVRLYAVELRHYEKIEGVSLSLDGKANRLAAMIKGNLDAALAGLAVVPLLAGYDTEAPDPERAGRIISYDVTGGRFEDAQGYQAVGSGSLFAKSAMKKLYDPDADAEGAARVAIEALYDAADDDSGTGGPDVVRRIYPVVVTITAEGAAHLPEERAAALAEAVVEGRRTSPTG
ncbi:proteasome subunit beta [Saccharothrix syringae]|uniref:Proteasome subunit beta n=1 Tax=Saccharothrix syringae TaxID=103733 RepID=A0A5Q0H7F4_SACSY|nr:proteasome subunit beta [Saccharothrix syringae]QFZ21770.1 proteasome subunit beta [Saccharothrix syringae]